MRGSFCQALPIGCIRVFMTPSCSSAVTFDRRCSGTLNSVSSLRREISNSWLRVSTSSETMVIRCSSVSTLTRIDWLAILSASWTSVASATAAFRAGLALASFAALAAAAASGAGAGAAGLTTGARLRGRRLGRGFGLGLAEGAFEVVERDFAGAQRTFQHLLDQRALGNFRGHRGRNRRCGHHGRSGLRRRLLGMAATFGHRMQLLDQVFVGALGLGLGRLEAGQDFLDAIDGGQDQRHGFGLDRHAVAEFAHQGLAGMGQRFQPRQSQEAAGALDGVDQAEDVIQYLRVARVLLEPHQLIVDRIQALVGLRQELPQQIIHMSSPSQKIQKCRSSLRHNLSGFTATLISLSVLIRIR